MNIIRRARLFLPVLLLALGASGAHAQTDTLVTARPLTFTLTDLDLNDGIAPSLTWVDTISQSFGSYSVQQGDVAGTPNYVKVFEKTDTSTQSLGIASTVANGVSHAVANTVNGMLIAAVILPSGATGAAYALQGGHFQLSANTSVTFTTSVTATVASTTPADAPEPNGYFDWAYFQTEASSTLGHWIDGQGYEPYVVFGGADSTISSFIRSSEGSHDGFSSKSGTLSLTVVNDTTASVLSNVASIARTSGYTVTPPVPEASTAVQLMLGLVGIGAVARRRQQARTKLS